MKNDELFWNTKTRLSLIDNYAFTDFYQRLIKHLSDNPKSTKYDKICRDGYLDRKLTDSYQTANKSGLNCQLNVAMAFIEANRFLVANVS